MDDFVGPPPDANPSASSNPWLDALVAIVTAPFAAITAPFQAGADLAVSTQEQGAAVADTVIGGAVAVYDDITDTVETVANPLGLFGLGAGITTAGIVTTVALGLGTAFLADELLAAGAGRTALLARLSRSRR